VKTCEDIGIDLVRSDNWFWSFSEGMRLLLVHIYW